MLSKERVRMMDHNSFQNGLVSGYWAYRTIIVRSRNLDKYSLLTE